MEITIYTKDNIDDLPPPKCSDALKEFCVLKAFVKNGPQHFIKNAKTTIKALRIGDKVVPITISETPNQSSYVCSPYSHYVCYGFDEIKTLKNPSLKLLLSASLKSLGGFLRICQIDKNIVVNNWLTSTILHPEWTSQELKAIIHHLSQHYPEHAILFRSINSVTPQGLFERLKKVGFSFVLSRTVYYTDTGEEETFKSRMFKSDKKILAQSSYTITTDHGAIQAALPRIKDLYFSLNIQKYSACNPQYNEEFIKLTQETGWMQFKVLERNGNVDAALGYFSKGNMMTSPFFGYDTSLPDDLGLYRQISTQLLLDAFEKKSFLHQSSGAGHYKKLRRAKEVPEYTAVYHSHLNFKRKFGWKVLKKLMGAFGKKFMNQK